MRISFILTIALISCSSQELYYNKQFYENISSMVIPEDARILESIDNGEFVTATTFLLNKEELLTFAQDYGFKSSGDNMSLGMLSMSYLEKDKPDFEKRGDYLYRSGQKGKNSWIYIIDLRNGLLWAEIGYPDAGGT